MSNKLKTFISISFSVLISTTIIYFVIYAGSLSPSSTPADTLKTLDDIYHKLTSGSGESFGLNPPASPTSTMHSLQEIYDVTPDFASSPGDATSSDVCNSRTFYTDSSTRYTGTRTACQSCTAGSISVAEMSCSETADIDCDGELEIGTEPTPCLTQCASSCVAYTNCTTGSCGGASNCSSAQSCQDGSGCASGYPSQCHVCTDGSIVDASDTTWGAETYGCSGSSSRCLSGVCTTCSGWMNAGYCWYNGSLGESCTSVCSTHGGVYQGTCDWVNDPSNCSTCQHWYAKTCAGNGSYGPDLYNNSCYYHSDGSNNCGASANFIRQCACNS